MAYATEADLTARFGIDEINALAWAPDAVPMALTDAEELANTYVARRHAVPLLEVPAPLQGAVCDIARYLLYKDKAPDQVRDRYNAAVRWLQALADGKVQLLLGGVAEPPAVPLVVPVSVRAVSVVFDDSALDRMPRMDRAR